MRNDPTGATAEGVSGAEITSMSVSELMTFVNALTSAIDGFFNALNQPRMRDGSCANAVSQEIERLSRLRMAAVGEMEGRPSDGGRDAEERIRIVASYDMGQCGAGIIETMEKMARLYADHEAARDRYRTSSR